MTLAIENNRLLGAGIIHRDSPNHGGLFEDDAPDMVVLHYTAADTAEGAIRYLCDSENEVSAHVFIGRDGSITQMLSFDVIAWHAGESSWQGRTSLNACSIGIEFDNAGLLRVSDSGFTSHQGGMYQPEDVICAIHQNRSEPAFWHNYTDSQITSARNVCRTLIAHYGIRHILGHDEVAPERKLDPGPAFPLDTFRAELGV